MHARVRRRAARRRASVATGATLAVAATGAVAVTARTAPSSVTPLASASATPSDGDAAWRQEFHAPRGAQYADGFDRLSALVRAHPDVFLGLTVQGTEGTPGWLVAVAVGSDVDPEQWRARVAEAAGSLPWAVKECQRPTSHYDAVAERLTSATWPSGATIESRDPHAVRYAERCQVHVALTGTTVDARDRAYAAERFGDDVYVYVKPAPSPAP